MFFSVAYYKGRAEVQFYLRSFSRELGEQIFFFFFPLLYFLSKSRNYKKAHEKNCLVGFWDNIEATRGV